MASTPTTTNRAKTRAERRALPGVHRTAIEPPSNVDRLLHAAMGQLTQGISPSGLAVAWFDWSLHLAQSPAKWQRLVEKAWHKDLRWFNYALRASWGGPVEPCIKPLPQDRRFLDPAWQRWPYNLLQQGFLLNQQWWHNATTGIDGVSKHHEQVVSFAARQLLDMVSPVNFVATNPEVLETTVREGGANFVRGAIGLAEDARRSLRGDPQPGTEAYRPGIEVAVTPGQVVFRNHLFELIQYAPGTPTVHAEPILIVPAWIMKYYILDLSPHNSLVRYLVERGHTVFMMSWHNPSADDRDMGMDDYLHDGVMAAFKQVGQRVPDQPINAVGYCLGGTLLSIAAAALACEGSRLLNSMTLLAAQTDFSEAGELSIFIDESQLAWLEDLMWQQGYLDNRQMAGAFKLLRSHDLVWSIGVSQYLLGQRAPMNDLMAWNADATRMPYRMHSEYLRKLFLNNDLVSGRYRVNGRPVVLRDISVPMFAVATLTDHVSPWRSVHKIHLLTSSDVTFVLTSGGHNAGIVSEPSHRGRYYYTDTHRRGDCYSDPDRWIENADEKDGSWWPEWAEWLEQHSHAGAPPPGPPPDALGPAPGRYVLER
ncbi:PHA/PHB synthase family protein [Massilia glaciei]|uniref:Poly-beta-hydroxybutyrate polymerase n=1 Tax=Massilia glaciei TaxID=1524097 RepID=A0A2U2I5B4_9BURK|nr:alpha/beta fold hydrolase [Massilia glaciei]PWF54978.1 poly-beta-hydroxybutyrate polymerase [Massilia glaciei]